MPPPPGTLGRPVIRFARLKSTPSHCATIPLVASAPFIGLEPFRADKGRKYKPNDWQDFYHAVTALPYFDFLLTERSLKHVLTTPPLCLDALYGAQVLCGEEEILACEFAKPTKAAS
jgi:hypothetical protein